MICPNCGYNGKVKGKEFKTEENMNSTRITCPICDCGFLDRISPVGFNWQDIAKLTDRVMILESKIDTMDTEIHKKIANCDSDINGIFRRLEKIENQIKELPILERQMGKCLIDCNELKKHDHFHNHATGERPIEVFTFKGNMVVCGDEMAFVKSDTAINKQFVEFANKHKNKCARVYYEVL